MMHEWFRNAKLGIFIHWGIYAVKGVSESWSFYHGSISYKDYMDQLKGFTASKYDPQAWAQLIKDSGAKYSILTTKHHDGVALWNTKANNLSTLRSPAGRDLLTPWVKAIREQDIKVGLYFSLLDWSNPDYYSVLPENDLPTEYRKYTYDFTQNEEEDFQAWERFLNSNEIQLKELSQYNPDLLWFDGDWWRSANQWRASELRDKLHKWNPGLIINSRFQGYGDYDTPEQGIPITRPKRAWEFCITINDNWGFRHSDTNFKSPEQVIKIFIETIAMGGNMLLDIGPREDGTIPIEEQEVLKELGIFIKRNEEAIYYTRMGLPYGHTYAPTTLSKDKKTLYYYHFGNIQKDIFIKGIFAKIKKITYKDTTEIKFNMLGGADWNNIPGILWFDIDREEKIEKHATVIKIELEEPLRLYRKAGQAIDNNEG